MPSVKDGQRPSRRQAYWCGRYAPDEHSQSIGEVGAIILVLAVQLSASEGSYDWGRAARLHGTCMSTPRCVAVWLS